MLVSFVLAFVLLRTISPSAAQPALDPKTLTSACGQRIVENSVTKLGEGRDGIISQVKLINYDSDVALKTSEYKVPGSYENGNWLAKERLAKNPYGVEVYDACVDQGYSMVIMQLAQGLTIWDTIVTAERYKHIGTREANILEDFCQVFEGVLFMHENSCTHNDVNALNVIITEAGVRIIDYDRTECWLSSDDYQYQWKVDEDGGGLSVLLVFMMTPYEPLDLRVDRLFPMMRETFDEAMTEELRNILHGVGFNEEINRFGRFTSDTTKLYKGVCLDKPKLFKEPEPDDGQPST